ncbi:hypothetical protein B0T17DRAFT_617553 [Bombardia bombarda]|uniref:Uncharacterized protein n=1 Tax=Bombardia bombarda TaxID=252184 RepID=A0AA39X1B3_9PEZI|nr:hypothetical protein B0T17DRAFT_617553 [Bombardia bombarda]
MNPAGHFTNVNALASALQEIANDSALATVPNEKNAVRTHIYRYGQRGQHPRPPDTLDAAAAFYGTTLGLTPRPVPQLQRDRLAWFDIADSGQQLHVAFGRPDADFSDEARGAARHPCFRIGGDAEALRALQERIWAHFVAGGGGGGEEAKTESGGSYGVLGAPTECDRPGGESSGSKGVEYPTRFFARDYAGNRLEFSL